MDALWLTEEPGAIAPWRLWAQALGRTLLWLLVVVAILAVAGFVLALAHHAAPAGGGG